MNSRCWAAIWLLLFCLQGAFRGCTARKAVVVPKKQIPGGLSRSFKPRRLREGKTNYRRRKQLISSDLRTHLAPKYNLVVRITQHDIIAQIRHATLEGDIIDCVAYSHELPLFGVRCGLTCYAAAYCTGLLLARRTKARFRKNHDPLEPPLRAVLDIGMRRATAGHRIFGAMKGACDGGMVIPHSEAVFPGWNKDDQTRWPQLLRRRIFAMDICDDMNRLKEGDPFQYKTKYRNFISMGLSPEDVPKMFERAHKAIAACSFEVDGKIIT